MLIAVGREEGEEGYGGSVQGEARTRVSSRTRAAWGLLSASLGFEPCVAYSSARTNSRIRSAAERPMSIAENCSSRQLVSAVAVVMRETCVRVSVPTARPCTPPSPPPATVCVVSSEQ